MGVSLSDGPAIYTGLARFRLLETDCQHPADLTGFLTQKLIQNDLYH
jgi:hypothetical protein